MHTQYRVVRKRQLLDATVHGYGGPIDVKCNNLAGLMSPAAALVPRCTLSNAHEIMQLLFLQRDPSRACEDETSSTSADILRNQRNFAQNQ